MIQSTPTIQRMKKRPQFLAAASSRSEASGAVVIQRRDRADGDPIINVGFTATKKVGGSVIRNRARRRLKEAARLILPRCALPGSDYVFVARQGTPDRPWARLLDDVERALTRLADPEGGRPGRSRPGRTPTTPPAEASGQDR